MSSRGIEDKYSLATYPKLPFALVRGEGCYVWDDTGKRYLDLYGGHAVSCLGHGHPRWVEAIAAQARAFDFYSNICYLPIRAEASELLVTSSYPSMVGSYFCNSGAEANETALKIARKLTHRSDVVALVDGFHGRTIAALSVTGIEKMRKAFPENLDRYTSWVPHGDLAALEALDPRKIAAVILEPIPSLGGVRVAPPDYYRGLRAWCTRHQVALIFDEVQTGNGRTGKWFVGQHWGVEPDLVTTAKAVGGGFPVGAVIANAWVAADVKSGDQGSTFGGGPMACAAVAATYRILKEERLVERVARSSIRLIDGLTRLSAGGRLREVRGLGYLLGIECDLPAKDIQARLLAEGIFVGTSNHPNTFRLLPPFTVSDAEWDFFLSTLERVLRTAP